jgi:hypothetical protein
LIDCKDYVVRLIARLWLFSSDHPNRGFVEIQGYYSCYSSEPNLFLSMTTVYTATKWHNLG